VSFPIPEAISLKAVAAQRERRRMEICASQWRRVAS